ncbi:hypothetical protein M5D96_011225 [Drosophila gunungcola]|uniref:Uncharacterized protein n=1 Tax=Drosophila gunungcola TaxID=103775 RepID=A0A9P9YFG1_9MUSC|nr:hypothetical protein M5D96_011225 [Drosophila gunungcola]
MLCLAQDCRVDLSCPWGRGQRPCSAHLFLASFCIKLASGLFPCDPGFHVYLSFQIAGSSVVHFMCVYFPSFFFF